MSPASSEPSPPLTCLLQASLQEGNGVPTDKSVQSTEEVSPQATKPKEVAIVARRAKRLAALEALKQERDMRSAEKAFQEAEIAKEAAALKSRRDSNRREKVRDFKNKRAAARLKNQQLIENEQMAAKAKANAKTNKAESERAEKIKIHRARILELEASAQNQQAAEELEATKLAMKLKKKRKEQNENENAPCNEAERVALAEKQNESDAINKILAKKKAESSKLRIEFETTERVKKISIHRKQLEMKAIAKSKQEAEEAATKAKVAKLAMQRKLRNDKARTQRCKQFKTEKKKMVATQIQVANEHAEKEQAARTNSTKKFAHLGSRLMRNTASTEIRLKLEPTASSPRKLSTEELQLQQQAFHQAEVEARRRARKAAALTSDSPVSQPRATASDGVESEITTPARNHQPFVITKTRLFIKRRTMITSA